MNVTPQITATQLLDKANLLALCSKESYQPQNPIKIEDCLVDLLAQEAVLRGVMQLDRDRDDLEELTHQLYLLYNLRYWMSEDKAAEDIRKVALEVQRGFSASTEKLQGALTKLHEMTQLRPPPESDFMTHFRSPHESHVLSDAEDLCQKRKELVEEAFKLPYLLGTPLYHKYRLIHSQWQQGQLREGVRTFSVGKAVGGAPRRTLASRSRGFRADWS